MNGRQLNTILNIGAKHALYREDGKWYHPLTDFPGVLFDKNGYVVFTTKSDYLNHPHLSHTKDLHINLGISSLKEYVRFSAEDYKKIILTLKTELDEESIRVIRQIGVIVRNTALVKEIKGKYNNACQLCGTRLMINSVLSYSEVRHIKPLGNPHNGPDQLDNMICVCPNCHVLLDFGVIELDLKTIKSRNHDIKDEYILYHNQIRSKS